MTRVIMPNLPFIAMLRRCALALLLLSCTAGAQAATVVNIGFFQEWPSPNLVAKAQGDYETAMQVPVRWFAFDTGTQMTEALSSGEIDIAYSQGLAPFVSAVNRGAPIRAVAAAIQYPANDCVVRDGVDIDADVPASLEGRSVAVPLATAADFSFRLMLRALEVDSARLTIIDRIPADGAVLLVDGEVDMACGFGALAMAKMYAAGEPLLSAEQKLGFGIESVDLVSVRSAFIDREAELLGRFLEVTEAANRAWTASPEQVRRVGLESGLDTTGVLSQLADFSFPSAAVQRRVLFVENGPVEEAMRVAGEIFASDEAPALDDYSQVIDLRHLP